MLVLAVPNFEQPFREGGTMNQSNESLEMTRWISEGLENLHYLFLAAVKDRREFVDAAQQRTRNTKYKSLATARGKPFPQCLPRGKHLCATWHITIRNMLLGQPTTTITSIWDRRPCGDRLTTKNQLGRQCPVSSTVKSRRNFVTSGTSSGTTRDWIVGS
jgi:hypothetical protein